MPISQQSLHTLEFPKILERLTHYVSFSASRDLALALLPSTDVAEVRFRLQRTAEARLLLNEQPDLSIGGARDVRGPARRAQRGGVLDAAMFVEIAATLASMRQLRGTLRRLDAERMPILVALGADLPSLPEIEDAIARTVGEDGTVLDSASPQLARLRSEVRIAFQRLQDRLQSMISTAQYSDALQEPIITIRNGRYVVPVKAAQRRAVRGLVHDQSSSGATLYIEPMAIVELNNRWQQLQSAEEEEVARILAELSERIGAQADAIIGGVETLAVLDLALALARYADALQCVQPEIVESQEPGTEPVLSNAEGNQEPSEQAVADNNNSALKTQNSDLVLTQARHPLLDQHSVVPTDLWLGGAFRLLLITGPNTGGKTVALKTTGLLALMAQAGMHIPAQAPARLPVFQHIFADIGDEQSIEQSLSTFSSHMSNIIRILRALEEPIDSARLLRGEEIDWSETGGPALVLLDELGAGTDPVEGAALARAIIGRLLDLNVLGIATTHYAELKAFAYTTEGVENASVEFNVETLAPTYRLTIGIPGRSNALAIATRLGLDPTLVEQARGLMTQEEAQVEDLLAGIRNERETAAAEQQRAAQLREDAEKYRDRLADELREFEQQRESEWQAARDQIESELREVRGQLRRLRDEVGSVSVTRRWMEEAEQRIQATRASLPEEAPGPRRVLPVAPVTPQPSQPRPIQVGDTVQVRSIGLTGEVLSIDEEDQTAEVQVGGFRMQAELRELRREKNTRASAPHRAESTRAALPPVPDVGMTFDIRGWRAAEVNDKLDRYLNDAYLAGLPSVRVIHGKGTGALRQVVRDVVGGHPLVKSFGSGGQEGGDGVTVVRLVER